MLNILTEPLIWIATTERTRIATLPKVYAALMADEVEAFPALRPHQRHAWHAFLVQLGAMAMHRAGITEPPEDAAEWEGLIRGVTPEHPDDEPWQLVVEDITKPAFMQPPARSADKLAEYKGVVATPDELDMLVTSKNHDLKASVAAQAGADDWIFALVTLQTMDGNPGRNPGISRMNGSHSNRPAFSITPSARTGPHISRDIIALQGQRESLVRDYLLSNHGETLLWTLPWDGMASEALNLSRLDPFYIEICRLLRLYQSDNGRLYAQRATAKSNRINAKSLNGKTGDPWTPIDRKENKSLTLAKGGFTYGRVSDYLTSADWEWPPLLNQTVDEQHSSETTQLVSRAMVRGQGKTEGYYERIIPLRPRTLRNLGRPNGKRDLGTIAKRRVDQIATVRRILSHAVRVFVGGGDDSKAGSVPVKYISPWLNRLDEIVDARFFDDLQTEFEADDTAERDRIHNHWLRGVVLPNARNILHDAEDSLPCPAIHRYRARVNAEGLFEGRLRGNSGLPFLFDDEKESSA